jgi:phosphoenolpyruvate carboxylase
VGGARGADDVLAPLVLARWAHAHDRHSGAVMLDVAPQFDTVSTLGTCGDVMRQLLDDKVYRKHLDGRGYRQTVLVGFSDSNKESGIVASRLAAYRAQRSLAQALDKARDAHVLFYARGGSVPRGGGRIDALLQAAPADSVSGILRFTEQGEGISQNYGLRPNAMRTLERAFGSLALATLAVKRKVAVQESGSLAECVRKVAEASSLMWKELLATPGFNSYFRAVTPIDVIERMQIGAHNDREAMAADFREVRPPAWVHAWSQSRHLIPGWYGAGSGLESVEREQGIELLRRSYLGWPFFRLLIDDIEAMLATADLRIARHYDQLAPAASAPIAQLIRAEYARSLRLVLAIKECETLLDDDRTLQRSIALRNPYVDPMNLMQVDLLRRWREGGREDRALLDALVASVAGIARGLQTNG